ncbi:bacteriocin [Amphibacillus indicireducens]|uniref:Bacteriocin n=1 Tax=Amphibacillus indicireducens TaxID=1076330 RepID=A0ABP7V4G1_9BACI
MDITINNNLSSIDDNELANINGGGLGLGTVLFTVIGYKVTVGGCLKAGSALGLAAGGAIVIRR